MGRNYLCSLLLAGIIAHVVLPIGATAEPARLKVVVLRDTLQITVQARQGIERIRANIPRPKKVPDLLINSIRAASNPGASHFQPALLSIGQVRERGARAKQTPRDVLVRFHDGGIDLYFISKRYPKMYRLQLTATGRTTLTTSRASHGCAVVPKVAESRHPASSAASRAAVVDLFTPPRRLDLAIDADLDFYNLYGADSLAKIQTAVAAAELFYTRQIGLRFNLVTVNIFSEASPYSSTSSEELLTEFQQTSVNDGHLGQADVYHLITGKNVTGRVVGLAYIGQTCINDGYYSFSLSQLNAETESIHPIVLAHELGHNLGALHPEEVTSNSLTPSLMSGSVRASNTRFSEFSRSQLRSFIRKASCLSRVSPAISLRAQQTAKATRLTVASSAQYPCTVSLYGAKNPTTLKKSNQGGQLFGQLTVSAGQSASVRVPGGRNLPESFSLRATTTCQTESGTITESTPQRTVRGSQALLRRLGAALPE